MNKFLIGYSLGSVLAFNTAVNKQDFFDGVVVIAPPIILELKENSFKYIFLSFLNKIFPGFPVLSNKSKKNIKNLVKINKND
jgi:alpha-beta hydrolase superfamily lysophospholipase